MIVGHASPSLTVTRLRRLGSLALLGLAAHTAGARDSDEFNRGGLENVTSIAGDKDTMFRRGTQQATPLVSSTTAAPPYAVSGRLPELNTAILAQTPRGPVTALDLLIFDNLNARMLSTVPIEALINPHLLKSELSLPAIRKAIEQMTAMQELATRAGGWQPPADELRVACFGPAIAAYTELYVQDQVKVETADIDHYYLSHTEQHFNRRRAELAYIFIPADPRNIAATKRARERLETVALEVTAGQRDFAAAARELSKAPSASAGGRIPVFYNGTYFPAFEEQAFSLHTPGELSSVFTGPGGLYLQQLVQAWPAQNIAIDSVTPEISAFLRADHIKFYYQHDLELMQRKLGVTNNSVYWSYMNLNAPVAQVRANRLEREEFFRYYPNPTDTAYRTQFGVVLNSVTAWAEGETVMQALEKRNQASHPYILRGREIATMLLQSRHVLRTQTPVTGAIPESAALETLKSQPGLMKSLRMIRLVSFTTAPKVKIGATAGEMNDAQRSIDAINEKFANGLIPGSGTPLNLKEWFAKNGKPNESPRDSALRDLKKTAEKSEWLNATIKFNDLDWLPAVPGTPWIALVGNLEPGEYSKPFKLGLNTVVYFLLAERPVDLADWKDKPLYLQNLAYNAEIQNQTSQTVAMVRSGIKYQF